VLGGAPPRPAAEGSVAGATGWQPDAGVDDGTPEHRGDSDAVWAGGRFPASPKGAWLGGGRGAIPGR